MAKLRARSAPQLRLTWYPIMPQEAWPYLRATESQTSATGRSGGHPERLGKSNENFCKIYCDP